MSNDYKFKATADLLDEDKPIAGQKFVCVSFVSPEKILKQKQMYYFQEFVKSFELEKSMTKFQQFLQFMSVKYSLDMEKLNADFKEFTTVERENLINTTIEDDYKNFLDAKEEELQKQFNIDHEFQTNVRGLKVRGSFPTQEEAEMRSRFLREKDPAHDIYVGQVGLWMAFDPEAYKNGRVEYMEKELNELMYEKQKNEDKARDEFEARVKETKQQAIAENKKIASESGTKIAQDITPEGELVSANNTNTTEERLQQTADESGDIAVANIREELFEGEEIRTKASDKLARDPKEHLLPVEENVGDGSGGDGGDETTAE